MGRERAHAELVGQRSGLAVGGCGGLGFRGLALGGNLTEEPQRIGLMSALLQAPGALEGLPGLLVRVRDTAGQQIRCAQMRHQKRIEEHGSCCCTLLYGLLDPRISAR